MPYESTTTSEQSLLTFSASCFTMYDIVSWFKSIHAFSTASSIVGTFIGFLTGIYIPFRSLPEAVQLVIKIFPPSHTAVLIPKRYDGANREDDLCR